MAALENLSVSAAERFVRETLELDLDLGTTDRLQLLTDIVSRFLETIPFTNLMLLAQPPGERRIPTVAESMTSVLEGKGGPCNTLNAFMFLLLKRLQFTVETISCSVKTPNTNDHLAVLAYDVEKPGDKWLVDVGFGSPCFEPICMDFEKESPEFTQSYMTFKYVREGDEYVRLQKPVKYKSFPSSTEDGWVQAYFFTLVPQELQEILDHIDDVVYRNPCAGAAWFHETVRIYSYRPGKKAILFRNNAFTLEAEDGTLKQEAVEGDVVDSVISRFPKIPEDVVRAAFANAKD